MLPRIILASASPSRERLLRSAGLNPEIKISGIDEEDPRYQDLSPKELVIALSIVKAHTVRQEINFPALIIGCDSTFEFEGESLGKPLTAELARKRARNKVENLACSILDIALLIQRTKSNLATLLQPEFILQK